MAGFMAILGASVDGLVMSPGRVVSTAQPALSLSMLAPKGPFGGSTADGEGWVGDRGRSAQVTKFEAGSDYLFFQGPAPKSAVQPDLPGLLTGENFAAIEDVPVVPMGVAAVAGTGAIAAVGQVLLS
eukprot:CAMPEP_0118831088 /NCGR_PEP_ID=MMETSP1162-20130426/29214_1 /TAXON_ID=33656 /ORGANISM="Phaeocystis Sp, Strain CCMP2710" /LENGTH=126 /DNA_ID=CAMNT_0006762469 /DNA_START=14 /DNA_END=394 /DNA_ORIENTATION=+